MSIPGYVYFYPFCRLAAQPIADTFRTVIESFFKSCTSEIVKSVRNQIKSHLPKVKQGSNRAFSTEPSLYADLVPSHRRRFWRITLSQKSASARVGDGQPPNSFSERLHASIHHFEYISYTHFHYSPSAKAVSDGAIIWFLKQSVIARATRFEFGIEIKNPATADLARVLGRKLMESKNGDYIHGYWSAIVSKVRISLVG
jgi:hypothetical protein